jgi:predicted hotdog family 3-hydroxylacyl-ACP dehydratase
LPGYLAAVRNVMLQEEFIDHITGPLQVHALLIATVTDSFMYRFTITGKHALLASARATVSVHRNATP